MDERNTVCNAIPDCQTIDDFSRVQELKLSKSEKRDIRRREDGGAGGRRRRKGRRTRWKMHGC